jgi:glucose/arabinose dehydrogenase
MFNSTVKYSVIAVALLVALSITVCTAEVKKIKLPPDFRINVFASRLGNPQFMALDSRGNLFVTLPRRGEVLVLTDEDGRGKAAEKIVFAHGLDNPHGIAFHGDYLYVAEEGRIVRFTDRDGDLRGEDMEVVVAGLPSDGGHWTRTVGFGPRGRMYVSIGSSCNVCVEKDGRRAAIMVFDPDGGNGRIFALGLRNSVGFVWDRTTGRMWATDNGRDWLGDDLPPDELNMIEDGAHYGWPVCYGNRVPDPRHGDSRFCSGTRPAAFEFQAHSAPLGLAFYHGDMFPARYKGDLFVAFHGSWNRSAPTGYKIVRINMEKGRPTGVEDFAAGWLRGRSSWGRPVDIVVDARGRMFVSDDAGGKIYLISYKRKG